MIAHHTLTHDLRVVGIASYALALGFCLYAVAHYARLWLGPGNGMRWMWATVMWLEANMAALLVIALRARVQRTLHYAPPSPLDYLGVVLAASIVASQYRIASRLRRDGRE